MARIYLGNVKGPQGETGATGATGPQGEAATIEVGSVSTTAYGNAAQVTNVGTENDAILNFVIPQGKPGERTTTMGGLTLDTITTSTEEFPSPAVGDTGATAFGKIVKFFSDVLASLTNKIDVSKIANDFTTTDPSYVAAAPTVKALNDSLTNLDTYVKNADAEFATLGTGFSGTVKVYRAQRVLSVSIQVETTQAISNGDITLATSSYLLAPSAGNTYVDLYDYTDHTVKRLSCVQGALKLQYAGAIASGHQLQGTATYLVNI